MLLRFKQFLKRNPFVYEINARLKATQTRFAHAKLKRKYARLATERGVVYSEASAIEQLRARIAGRESVVKPIRKGQLRIFWIGANWEQDNSGFLVGMSKFGDIICSRNIHGDYGLLYVSKDGLVRIYDPEVVKSNDICILEQVESALKRGPVDVLMGQMWANLVSVETLREIQRMGVVTVNVSMDDRLPENWGSYRGIRLGSVGLCRGIDLMLTSSSDCCLRYAVEGCPCLFWPPASDPEFFKPYDEDKKEYDVSFVGTRYGLRGRLIRYLKRAGIRVEAFGRGWPNGPVSVDQSAEIFGKSRIILGVGTIAYSEDIFQFKLRDFDATMAGALYITHRNPDLLALFEEGKEIECYLSIDECVRKIRYYLDHPERRMAIAAAAAARARRDHTWEHRLSSAFSAIGLLPAQRNLVSSVD